MTENNERFEGETMFQGKVRIRSLLAKAATLALLAGIQPVLGEGGSAGADRSHGAHYNDKTPEGMVRISGGIYAMGIEGAYGDESPVHSVTINSFYVDKHEVTNREFMNFVDETGYITTAEMSGYSWCYIEGESDFQKVVGADWRHPEGPGSSIDNRMDNPVVSVSWYDSKEYAQWAGKRLLTEAEWEYVARAGSDKHYTADISRSYSSGNAPHSIAHGDHNHEAHAHFVSSNDISPSSKSHSDENSGGLNIDDSQLIKVKANIWQGAWPSDNALADGFYYSAPVGQFPANNFGVHDMLGNVWEWTNDWYARDYYRFSPEDNPGGPSSGNTRVARGGSWFCSPNYCGAYSSYYRGASPPDHTFNNVGFRTAMDIPQESR